MEYLPEGREAINSLKVSKLINKCVPLSERHDYALSIILIE